MDALQIPDDILDYGEPDFGALTAADIIDEKLFASLYSITDPLRRSQAEAKAQAQARELQMLREFNKCYKVYKISVARDAAATSGNITEFTGQPIPLRCGRWLADDDGVRIQRITQDGGNVSEYASPIPILPTEILRNLDTGTEKIKIMYKKHKWQSVVCDRSTVASTNKIIELANKGIEVNSENARPLVKYIADCVALNLDRLPCNLSVSRLGWLPDGGFMPYVAELTFDGERENKPMFDSVTPKGDYGQWKIKTAEWRKNPLMRLTMAAAFASPLIKITDNLPFVFHLWGYTGSGKTVALMVAASIWGNPASGKMLRTMNMTANSMMETSAFLNNLPFFGDELQTIKSQYGNYDKMVMQVTQGEERGRMEYTVNKPVRSWRNSFIFSGEEPCTRPDSGGGVLNRVIEAECSSSLLTESGNKIVEFISGNYGHAGKHFIEAVSNDGALKERYEEYFSAIMADNEIMEKQAQSAALMLLADLYVTAYIYSGEAPLSVDDIKPYLRTKDDVDVPRRAYEYTINLIARNVSKFESISMTDPRGETWGRLESNAKNGEALINKDVLTHELMAAGFDFEAVKKKWADNGWLTTNSQGRHVHATKCYGIKAMYVKIKYEQE